MDTDYNAIEENQPVAEGEYTLVIDSVKEKQDDSGNTKGLLVILAIEGQDNAANVMHNLSLPLPTDEDEKKKNKLLFMKRFLTLFNIPFNNGLDLTSFLGKRAKCFLVQDDYQGTISNKIKLPSIK
jgi:hypothetical protein